MQTLAEAKFPVELHAATGSALERRRLVERRPNGYILTEYGDNYVQNSNHARARQRLRNEFPPDLQGRLDKAIKWIEFVGRMKMHVHTHARPCLMTLLLEREPLSTGNEKSDRFIREECESALEIVEDYEVADTERIRSGATGLHVEFSATKARPHRAAARRRRDLENATGDDGTVDLGELRKRRWGKA